MGAMISVKHKVFEKKFKEQRVYDVEIAGFLGERK
jgi:hypothetical protein